MSHEIEKIRSARQAVRFMGMGFMPSDAIRLRAQAVLREYVDSGDSNFTPSMTFNVIKNISHGMLPSQEKCTTAGNELTQIIFDMKDNEKNSHLKSIRHRH